MTVVSPLRDFAEERQREFLDVLAPADPGVHHLPEEDHAHGDEQSDDKSHGEDVASYGRCRHHAPARRSDHPRVVGREGLRELVLLALLQQEEVEGLLDLLLAFHREQVFGLRGVGGDARRGLLLVLLQAGDLRVEREDLVVDRGDDRPAHLRECLIHIHDQRVLRAGVGHQAVALKQFGVVLRYLRFDVGALDSRVGRQQLCPVVLVGEVVPYVAGHVELVAQSHDLGIGLAALRHVEARGGLHVGQEVFALVGGDVLVHIAQFPLDDAQTLVDEHRGRDGDLVLVPYPVLVVYRDHGVQYVLGPLRGDVAEGKVDGRSLLVAQGDGQITRVAADGSVESRPGDLQLTTSVDVVIGRRSDLDPSQRRCQRVGEVALDDLLRGDLFAVADELRQLHLTARAYLEGEAGRFVLRQFGQRDGQGQRGPVCHAVLETAGNMVVHVQVQPLYDLEHDRGRLEYEQLVVYVCGGLEESEVPERFDIGGQRLPLGVLLDEQRGRAGVDRGGLQQVEECQAQGDQQRKYEPFPFGQAKVEQILDLNGIVHRFGGGRILGHFHMVRLLLFLFLGFCCSVI